MKKIVTFAVMCSTALYTILPVAAFADTVPDPQPTGPGAETLAAMQTQCDDLAAAHDTANGDIWTGEVVEGAVTKISGPTEVPDTRVIDESTIVGIGTPTYGGIHIDGDPYRIGGSVNMFGTQRATEKTWPDSTYYFDADFETTFSYAFSCDILQAVYHPATPPGPVEGYYVIEPTDQGNEEQGQQSCDAFTALGPTWEHWGQDHAQCDFVKTSDGTPGEDAYLDEPAFVTNEAGTPIEETQTDTLTGFEDHGGPVTAEGDFFVGQVVVCISPSKSGTKLPGSWTKQNGYTGDKCTAAWYQGTSPYSLANYAGSQTPNLNDGSHNWVTIPDYQLP